MRFRLLTWATRTIHLNPLYLTLCTHCRLGRAVRLPFTQFKNFPHDLSTLNMTPFRNFLTKKSAAPNGGEADNVSRLPADSHHSSPLNIRKSTDNGPPEYKLSGMFFFLRAMDIDVANICPRNSGRR